MVGTPIRVLHVDDDAAVRDLAATRLEQAGLDVTGVPDGEAALDALPGEFDAVVSDYRMPGVDGLDLLARVREEWPDLPFVLYTGQGSEEVASEAIDLGVTGYVRKGVGSHQYELLANEVRQAVEARRAEAELDRTEERHRRLVEQSIVGIYIVKDGELAFVNRALADLLGYDEPETLIGEPLFEHIAESDHETVRERVRARERGEVEDAHYTLRALRRDGTELVCEVHGGRIEYEGGPAIMGVLLDVTDAVERRRELEHHRVVVDNMQETAFVFDHGGEVVFVNSRGLERMGMERSAVEGTSLTTLARTFGADEETAREYREHFEVVRDGDREAARVELDQPVEEFPVVEMRLSGLPGGDGVVAVLRDVTEQRRREQRLDFLKRAVDSVGVGVAIYDDAGRFTYVNDAYADLLGYESDDLVDRPVWTVNPTVEAERFESYWNSFGEGETRVAETVHERADGTTLPVEAITTRVTAGDRTVHVGTVADRTDRERRERVLESLSGATSRLLEATTPESVAEVATETAREALGFSLVGIWLYEAEAEALRPAAFTGESDLVFEDMPTYRPGNSLSWRAFESGEFLAFDDVREAEGAYDADTPVRSELVAPLGDHGVINVGATEVGAFDDVDRQALQVLSTNVATALDRVDRELALEESRELLEVRNERLREFAGVVSHDLRNPLTVATGTLAQYRESGEDEHLEQVGSALERMDAIVSDLLALARHGQEADEREPVDLAAAARRAWDSVETDHATLAVETDRAILADPGLLGQLLENLFRNSVEHGATAECRGVHVTVGDLSGAGEDAGFYVADDGPGIPPDARERVFEPGYSTGDGGTGLGLDIVSQLADAHGWSVDLAGTDGARFEVSGVELADEE